MTPKQLQQLIGYDESEWLDFKQEWPANNVTLIHDLLCLMNAYADSNRFLVFGVDDSRNVVGVQKDLNRKNNAEVHDLLRQSNFNRFPTLDVVTVSTNGDEVDVIVIADRPDKPFYLIADKRYGQKHLRAGVVYTRLGDTNTPLRECAPDEHVELMWRERFGFGLTPMQRFERLIDDVDNWERVDEDSYLYHKEFPEFTIRDGRELNDSFRESWTTKFPDSSASSFEVELRYHSTVLKKLTFVRCDGVRYRVPMPKFQNTSGSVRYQVNTDGLGYRVAQLYQQYRDDLDNALRTADVDLI